MSEDTPRLLDTTPPWWRQRREDLPPLSDKGDPTTESHAALGRAEASLKQVERIMSGDDLGVNTSVSSEEWDRLGEKMPGEPSDAHPDWHKQRLRIVALEAAAAICAGAVSLPAGATGIILQAAGREVNIEEWTLFVADQFLTWLEADARRHD